MGKPWGLLPNRLYAWRKPTSYADLQGQLDKVLRENCRLPENWTDSARPALGQQVVAYHQRRIADFPRMMIHLLA
jgi:hypothetical protein